MKSDYSTVINVGSHVRMTRRPYFSGKIVAIQRELFRGEGETLFFCRWHFKPDDWVSIMPLRPEDVEKVQENE